MEQFNLETWLQDKSRKVVTRDGREVGIYYSPTSRIPLIGRTSDNEIHQYTKDGFQHEMMNQAKNDLFFADEEEELTEFEKELQIIISEASHWTSDDGSMSTYCQFGDKEIKKISVQILDLARKELDATGWRDSMRKYKEAYEQGKEDALKDLPKWIECEFSSIYPSIVDKLGNAKLCYKNHKIDIKELIEKLPKE